MRLTAGTTPSVDITDRAARALGAVSAAAGATWDVSDRAARLLGRAAEYMIAALEVGPGLVLNAAAGTVIADSGALPAGLYKVQLIVGSDTNFNSANLTVQHRNAANTANNTTFGVGVTAAGVSVVVWVVNVALNERIRLVAAVALAGSVGAGLTLQQVG